MAQIWLMLSQKLLDYDNIAIILDSHAVGNLKRLTRDGSIFQSLINESFVRII